METAKDLKARISMPEVLGWLGLRASREGKIHCPEHTEKTPSCHVYPDHYHCFGCGAHGDIFDTAARHLGLSFTEAMQWVGDRVGADVLPARPTLPVNSERVLHDFTDQLIRRGQPDRLRINEMIDARYPGLFTADDLIRWGCRTNEQHLLIPMFDEQQRARGVKTRRFTDGAKGAWPGSRFVTLYTAGPVRRGGGRAAVVEGESDCWALQKARPDLAVFGLPRGAGSWKEEWATRFDGFKLVLVMTDMDVPGQRVARRIIETVGPTRAVRVTLPAQDVVDSLLEGWKVPV